MTTARVHIVGAGLAGLSAAVTLAGAGRRIALHEAGPAAGGRCRSYFDRDLGCRVDNGNHLLLAGNRAALGYLERIGARDTLCGPAAPEFAFLDARTGARWVVRPNAGRLPWWILSTARRVPGTRWSDYLALLALRRAGAEAVVADVLPAGALFERLLDPLSIAALNTPSDQGSARLLAAVVDETLLCGGSACVPLLPCAGLSESFVDPALAWLAEKGATIRFGRRIAGLAIEAERVTVLQAADGPIAVGAEDSVVLAVPPAQASALLPGLVAPDEFQAILNVHFRIAANGDSGFVGVIGGAAQWVFAKPGHLSVTISAANRLADVAAGSLAEAVWPDVRAAYQLPERMPPWRVVKERRATFAATPAQDRRRPPPRTGLRNLVLAGDWTATGLPATIEGAIRSGDAAAAAVLAAT